MLILFGFGTQLAPQPPGTAALLTTLAGVVLIAPFFFLSALGGEFADKYDKARVAERVKLYEIPVALIAAVGFYLHSIPILFVALLGFGCLGALFGPVKYGILPEKLTTSELSTGNALVEGATFLAILLGTIGGSIAITKTNRPDIVVAIIVVLSILCWVFARSIPAHGAAAPQIPITRNILSSTFRLLGELRADPRLSSGGHITSWFWLVGVLAMSLLPVLIKETIGGNEDALTGALIAFVIGIASGSMLAAQVSHDKPNLALVPLGAVMIALFAFGLAVVAMTARKAVPPMGLLDIVTSGSGILALLCLFGLALSGGLYIVPAFAAVQSWAPEDKRARTIASVNVLNAAYMTGGGIILAGLQAIGTPLWVLYLLLSVGSLVVMAYVQKTWASHGAARIADAFSRGA
jgi:acyl-[acyl-carrier-protein]-phospholipid O-acyltransferase/long-chain-fatty-acid--[acyl-carrier-protein] ligase